MLMCEGYQCGKLTFPEEQGAQHGGHVVNFVTLLTDLCG